MDELNIRIGALKYVAIKLEGYLNRYLFRPRKSWPIKEFNYRSYSRSAVEQLIDILIKETSVENPRSPEQVVNDFINKMDEYYEQSNNDINWFIFSTAREAIEEIRYLL